MRGKVLYSLLALLGCWTDKPTADSMTTLIHRCCCAGSWTQCGTPVATKHILKVIDKKTPPSPPQKKINKS